MMANNERIVHIYWKFHISTINFRFNSNSNFKTTENGRIWSQSALPKNWRKNTEWNVPFHCSLRRLIYLLSCGFERRTHEASWEIWADKLVFRFHLDAIGSSSSSRNDGKRQHLFSKENCLTAAFNFYLLCAPFFAEMEIHIKIIAYWKSVKEFSIWSYYSYVPSVAAGHVWIAFTCITST